MVRIKMKKSILVVAKSLGGGGSEVALIEFLNQLDVNKYKITLLLLDKDLEYKYRLQRNVTIKYIKFNSNIFHSLVSMYSFLGKVIKKIHLNKFFNIYDIVAKHTVKLNKKYDIAVDFYGYGSFTTAYLALNVSATKKAFWLHDEKMPWIVNVERYFKYYDDIFGVSKSIIKKFDMLYPKASTKSSVFYNVIDTDAIIKKAAEFTPREYNKNKFNILTVGRLTEQKGHDISIKAAKILKDCNIPFKWYVIGDGKDRKKLERLIRKYQLSDDFILLGRKNNPYPYIKDCDLFVLSSRHEGYSVALVEARVLKKLIVTSNFSANKEQIQDGKNGLISKLDPTDLAQNIKKIYFDQKTSGHIEQILENENINFDSELNKLNYL